MIFLAMHIPDGFLSVPVAAVGWLLMAAMIALALRQTRDQLGERQIPLMGILAAFVFAAQMINFPVAGGTSGHVLGGALIAILLGPWAAVLVMTSVITVQALLFQDGGLLALGFNVFNMGILTAFIAYAAYRAMIRLLGDSPRATVVAAALAAWVSVEAAATATALQLAISGTSSLNVAFPAMVGVHALIGLGEALITAGALAFLRQTRPDLIAGGARTASRGYGWIAAGLVIALALAFVSPLADSAPDGLERVAADNRFIDKADDSPFSILPDYTVPGLDHEVLTTILAGVIGVLIVAGVGAGVARSASHGGKGSLES
jgi:cobalt/nickel transport system permease protein